MESPDFPQLQASYLPCAPTAVRTSGQFAAKYRQSHGYRIVPVNPRCAATAADILGDAGLDSVMDRSVKIEHARLFGGLHWAGVNTRCRIRRWVPRPADLPDHQLRIRQCRPCGQPVQPWHHTGWHDGRRRQISLGQRQVSRPDRILAGLPRHQVLRNLWRLRILDACAHGGAAGLRFDALAVFGLADSAGHREPACAHGTPLRRHAQGGAVPPGRPARRLGQLPRFVGPPAAWTGPQADAIGGWPARGVGPDRVRCEGSSNRSSNSMPACCQTRCACRWGSSTSTTCSGTSTRRWRWSLHRDPAPTHAHVTPYPSRP